MEVIKERGQIRPAEWPKETPGQQFREEHLKTPRSQWEFVKLLTVEDLQPSDEGTSSCALRYGADSQLAVFHVPGRGYFCTQQMCPRKFIFDETP